MTVYKYHYPDSCHKEIDITLKECIIQKRNPLYNFCGTRIKLSGFCTESDGSKFYRIDPPISTSPTSLEFSMDYQGTNPGSGNSTLTNNVTEWNPSIPWSAGSNKSWLGVSPDNGTLTGSTALTVSVDGSGVLPGEHYGKITFTSSEISSENSSAKIFVELTVDGLYVEIEGPAFLESGQSDTWTADVSGTHPPYSYTWWKMYPCYQPLSGEPTRSAPCNTWIQLGSTGSSVTLSETESFKLKVKVVDNDNNIVYDEHSVTVEPARELKKSLAETDGTGDFSVRNFTNPFNPDTVIEFTLPESDFVYIDIYNMHGQLVKNMVAAEYNKGVHRVAWDATDNHGNRVPTGTYFCLMTANQGVKTLKMTLLK
ncbi:T9SS type A sorting domain-containing protein [candidate division KSB1 bacterium]|nr:T9SS type A sorting domain-containing protein [candidate division KSB1 bacterium]